MTDHSSTPIDLRIKRKRDNIDENKSSSSSSKKKSRNNLDYEIPLDLSVKSQSLPQHSVFNPLSTSSSSSTTTTIPFYDPTNLLFNSSALLYDLFLANMNSYYQQQQHQQQRTKVDLPTSTPKSVKQPSLNSSRIIKDNSTSKQESYACSCGEKYSNVAHLVSHLKITNHNAQLSSTHDEVAKLVRGQDIWLSRDTNPANQILKCLRCSLSFETLPDLTAHMMKTNHFTQLLPSSPSSASSSSVPTTTTPSFHHHSNPKVQQQQQQQQQQYSPTKILTSPSLIRSTCLICSQQFVREVDLVDHIQHHHQIRFNCTTCGMYFENENLYKEHILKEMHHRNGKANRNRDYFLNQCKTLQKRTLNLKPEQSKSRSTTDKDIELVVSDLLDRIVKNEEELTTITANALSLLQNFVTKQTPSTGRHSDLNNNYDDENSSHSSYEKSFPSTVYHHEQISNNQSVKSNESPLVSLEKMLSYPPTTIQSLSSTINDNGTMSNLSNNSIMTIKKKKFDKYRLFAEKMLRSTLS
ncbi:hypothetical protein I4U23_018267 [Adineta vaga]|nr:hypothetical protein I4U23_018267 [Adineta vaga]